MMYMMMMRRDGMIRLMLHLIWPDSRRFRTSLTGSLWTFLCSTIPQNVFEYICIFICSQQMMFVFCMELQDVLKHTLLLSDHGVPEIRSMHQERDMSRQSRDILKVTFFVTPCIQKYTTKYRQSSHRAADKGRLNPRQTRSPLPPPPLFSPASPSSPLYSTICHQLHIHHLHHHHLQHHHLQHQHLQHHYYHVYHLSSFITTGCNCNVWGQPLSVSMIFGPSNFRVRQFSAMVVHHLVMVQ